MRVSLVLRSLGLGAALIVAGCGSDAATGTPTTAAPTDTTATDTGATDTGEVDDTVVETGSETTVDSSTTESDTTVTDTGATDTGATDTTVTDTGDTTATDTTVTDTGDTDTGDTTVTDTTVTDTDADTEVVVQPLCSTDRGVGCECTFDSDCDSHICLSNEHICSAGCASDADCAFDGLHCAAYTDFLTTIRACVVKDTDACVSCTNDNDCANGYVCATIANSGDGPKACLPGCSSSFDCYSGTGCNTYQGGGFGRACTPDAGTCIDCVDNDGDGYGVGPDCAEQDCRDDIFAVHPHAPELCNDFDDNCDGHRDETFTVASDPDHCGDCQTACSRAHNTPTCGGGDCHLGACTDGYEDCDHDVDNGCEVNLADRCGSCDGAKNACGGCAALANAPGTACGTCGQWTCAGDKLSVSCVEPASCSPSVVISNNVTLSGNQSYNDLTVGPGGTLSVGTGGAGGGTLTITAVNVNIGAGGTIDASGKGGSGGSDGGSMELGTLVNDSGAGGGYGGKGGNGARDLLLGGAPYGTDVGSDIAVGSNGGSTRCRNTCAPCAPSDTVAGGKGGGLVVIKAKNVTIDGAILADGTAGAAAGLVELGAGGGSGGGVWIEAETVSVHNTGLVSANGGAGGIGTEHPFGNGQVCLGFGGSGGAGGRVKIVAGTYIAQGVVRAQGGAGASGPAYNGHPGAPGTVFTPSPACLAGFVDCDGNANTGSGGCETALAQATCGACGPYPGTVGAACGTCGSGTYACAGTGIMACTNDAGLEARNACGGCAALGHDVGASCGGGCGTWKCDSNESVACSSPGANACGGCGVLGGTVGGSCGACNQGTYACDGVGGLVCNNADLCENNLVVDATSLDVQGSVSYDHLSVTNGGVLHVAPYDVNKAGSGTLVLSVKTLVVDATSSIDASGMGGAGTAPGATMTAALENSAAGGGGYGGNGGDGFAASGTLKGGLAFGTLAGVDLSQGSNGGETRCRNTTAPCKNTPEDERAAGGVGGGLIDIVASVSVTIDGKILANGNAGQDGGNVELGGGGGSGGGIRINAPKILMGAASLISADGGKGGAGIQHANSLGFGGGGGGGGRIKLITPVYGAQGAVHAAGGAGGTAPATYQGKAGAAGTVSLPPTP